jgi:exosortase A
LSAGDTDLPDAGSPTIANGRGAQAERRAATACLLILAPLLLLWPTTETLLEKWSDSVYRAYTHGAIIVALSCFMLWRNRAILAREPARSSSLGFAVAVFLSFAWLIGYRSGLQILHQALIPLLAAAALWTAFGWVFARKAWLPVAYLFFAIPVWDAINPMLQWASAFAVRSVLRSVGIPVHFDGLEFEIPAGTFEIAGGCSGLHFLIVALAIAVLYGEVHRDGLRTRVKVLVLATVLALLTNWLRIAIIIVVGHVTQMQHYLVRGEHYSFGWAMFALAMVVFVLVVRRWPVEVPTNAASSSPSQVSTPAVSASGLALAGFALVVPALWQHFDANVADADRVAAHRLPQTVDGWRVGTADAAWRPQFANVDDEQARGFMSDAMQIDSYTGIYVQQHQGKELVGFQNRPFGPGFTTTSRARSVGDDGWSEISLRDRAGSEFILWSSYRIGARRYAQPWRSQLAYGFVSLLDDPVSSITLLRAQCADRCDEAREGLARFHASVRLADR